ncbi:MAG: hypothetical protein ABL893_17390 [Hyphomicrobium sp.]
MGNACVKVLLVMLVEIAIKGTQASAQELCAKPPNNAQIMTCNDIGFFDRSPYVDKIMAAVLQATQSKPIIMPAIAVCKLPGLKNALSIACPSAQQQDFRIFYDPDLMAELDVRSNNKFVTIGFFAHEVGHFVELMELKSFPAGPIRFGFNMPWVQELRADHHAGFVLAKMGATYKDVQAWQRLMFAGPSFSHPDAIRRIDEMLKGYSEGGGKGVQTEEAMSILNEIADENSRW